MTEPGTGSALLKVAEKIAEKAMKEGWLEKLFNIFKARHRVLVLGSTGVGKSNLLTSLKVALPAVIDAMSRTEFVKHNKLKIAEVLFDFIDTPGQIEHASRRNDAIRDAMKQGVSGILNVVAYGYHEHRTGDRLAFEADGHVREAFLERHRQIEIEQTQEWTLLLGDPRTAAWLITVMTKADLWWDRHEAVDAHYRTGAYASALSPAKPLNPVTLEYCSLFQKFYARGVLSGQVDDRDRARMKEHLLAAILAGVANGG